MRRIPVNAGPSDDDAADSGKANAVWLESPLFLTDQDFERLCSRGPVVCLVPEIPEGLQRHAFVYVKPTSGKPLIVDGSEYRLACYVTDVSREEGQQGYAVTLDSPILELAHPDQNQPKQQPRPRI